MASTFLTKTKDLILHSVKSKLLHTNRTSNSLFHHLHKVSPLPVRKHAGYSIGNRVAEFDRCFELAYVSRRSHSTTSVSSHIDQLPVESPSSQILDFPGGKVKFTKNLIFTSNKTEERVNCYRVLDDNGQQLTDIDPHKINEELAVKMYTNMVTLEVMDTVFYESQRQGKISFYATTTGEEAINIASAAALDNNDFVFPQYREPGALLWRGFSLQEFANQLFGNKYEYGKGRQMPIHYGSKKLNYVTVASTVA